MVTIKRGDNTLKINKECIEFIQESPKQVSIRLKSGANVQLTPDEYKEAFKPSK